MRPDKSIKFPASVVKHLGAVHYLWLCLFLLSFLLQACGLAESLRYDRMQVEQGAVWLALSGNIVHLNWSHWWLNMAGLAIVAFFFSVYASLWQWLLVILLSSVCIGIGISYLNPGILYYVGLSGVLHGLFIFGALRETAFYPLSGYALLSALVAKLCWEFFYGALPGSEDLTGGYVLTDAHLYGAVGGLMVWLLMFLWRRFSGV